MSVPRLFVARQIYSPPRNSVTHTEVVPFRSTTEFRISAVNMGSVPLAEQQSLSSLAAVTTGDGSGNIIFGKANKKRKYLHQGSFQLGVKRDLRLLSFLVKKNHVAFSTN